MVKQNGKYYWDLQGIHTQLPTVMDARKLLMNKKVLDMEESKSYDRKGLTLLIREKINNGHRYMEVPYWMTAFRI